ncbi:MAG: lysylphosphatidylglycerol synthase transmembrane domain-containing protein [Bacteroidales bacterium]|nr:lysylphosphatidylglycerol synthase transmembrane domain-containing protein [Bacteroidales bacterium]
MSSKIKKVSVSIIKVFLPLLLGGLLLWYIYKDIEFSSIWKVVNSGVRYEFLLLSLIFGLGANMIRGLRWQLLINPLGYKTKRWMLILSVWGNYAVNLVLPRIGEIWRCGVVSKYENIPFSKVLGTLLVDRLYDTIAVLFLLLASFCMSPRFYFSIFKGKIPFISDITVEKILLFTAVFIVVLLILWILVKMTHRSSFFIRIKTFMLNVLTGFRSFWAMEHKWLFLFYTIGIWLGYFLYFYITFFAFGFTEALSPVYGLFVFVLTCISVAVPVQGAIGPWHFVVILGLTSLGIQQSDAAAFALIVHTLQTLWIALTGLLAVIALPVFYKSK